MNKKGFDWTIQITLSSLIFMLFLDYFKNLWRIIEQEIPSVSSGERSALLGKRGNGKVSKNVLFAQNQGFDLQGISFFKISLDQRHYLPNQNVFQLWWKGIAYLWKKNLKHLLIENSFHSRLDGNTLEGGQKWFARCKPILLKDSILQRFYMCLEVQELFLLK